MKAPKVLVPAGQNWSCHGCGDCCRGGMVIGLSPEERRRIVSLKWPEGAGPADTTGIVDAPGGPRLSHAADGACVFLDPAGRCRIHAVFGEAAKPLACRLYPYVFHPAGEAVALGLRFACPSAAAGRGRPLDASDPEIRRLAAEVVPPGHRDIPPPRVAGDAGGHWPDVLKFVDHLDATLSAPDAPVALKLVRALRWLEALELGGFAGLSGEGTDEILDTVSRSARARIPRLPGDITAPGRIGRVLLRLTVIAHATRPGVHDLASPGAYRRKTLFAAVRFVAGRGRTPSLDAELRPVPFAAVEAIADAPPAEAEALLTRYFRVKVRGLHFCGRGFHGRPLVEGFHALALLFPVVVWLARWLALSRGGQTPAPSDFLRAVSLADHHHGYSPYQPSRTRMLRRTDEVARLVAAYAGRAAE